MTRRTANAKEQQDWEEELAFFGLKEPDETEASTELWQENLAAVEWWLSIPGFLKWNNHVCLGMDVLAVQADSQLSERTSNPIDYQKLKVIARTVAEELNSREQRS